MVTRMVDWLERWIDVEVQDDGKRPRQDSAGAAGGNG
jgi:hypothetical protein